MRLLRGAVRRNRSLQAGAGVLDSSYTVSRAHTPSTAVAASLNAGGTTFVEYPQGVARYNLGNLVVEEQRTNDVPNPRGENPTGWTSIGSVVGRGVESGLDYVDVRFSGAGAITAAGSFAAVMPTVPGEVNTISFYARIVAGSLTNITGLQINILYRTAAAGVALNATQDISAALLSGTDIAKNRFTLTAVATGTSVDKAPRFRWVATDAFDVTIRFAVIQMEVGYTASQPMLPERGTPAVVTRVQDQYTRSIAPTKYSSRNLFTRSEDFGHAAWSRQQVVINTGAIAGPYTGTLADAMVATAATNLHQVVGTTITNAVIGARYTHSVYAKAGTQNFLILRGASSHSGQVGVIVHFDLTTGAATNIAAPSNINLVTNSVNVGGGWWRCSFTFTAVSPGAGSAFTGIGTSPVNAITSYLGDGVSEAMYIWGAQFTQSDGVPAYTRTVDSTAASHSKGTLVIAPRFDGVLPPSGYFPTLASLYDDANNHLTYIYNAALGSIELIGTTRGVANVDSQFFYTIPPIADQFARIALSWDTSTGYIASRVHNGSTLSALHTETLQLMPVMNNLGIGYGPIAPVQGIMQFRQVALYDSVTPASSLAQLIAA